MGEIEVVMNGVDFRTRHNDFRLLTPAASREYGAVEPVAMPDVPQAVLDIQKHCPTRDGCVPEQVREMQAWFEAWKNQDADVNDIQAPATATRSRPGRTTTCARRR